VIDIQAAGAGNSTRIVNYPVKVSAGLSSGKRLHETHAFVAWC